jgi:DNA invertase Pin-like site-specific DNA recombinase
MKKSENVVLYTRVANAKRKNINSETNAQEVLLRKHCDTMGYNVSEAFTEIGSGIQPNRPALDNLYTYIASRNGEINKVLLTTWDRCSRDVGQTLLIISKLTSLGVKVETSNQEPELSNSEHGFILSVYMAHNELQMRSEKIKMGLKMKKDGRNN